MSTNTSFSGNSTLKASEKLHNLQSANREELQTIIQVLAKITGLPSEAVKPHLDAMLEQLVKTKERPFYETATTEEWIQALHEWSASHKKNTPTLSDYAVSRAGIYEDEDI